jgi:FkbM family methyltransferase
MSDGLWHLSGVPPLREWKYELIRTPLEQPLLRLRELLGFWRRRKHPELGEIHKEDARIRALLPRLVQPGSHCIDAGCHYGSVLSRICALAPRGRHVAFEAIPSKVRFLRRKFPEVDVRETALGERAGHVTFYLNKSATGFSGLERHGRGEFESLEVECARLDDAIPRDRRFDFMKLDVEGAELMVLRGASELLKRDRPTLLFECGPSGPQAFGYAAGEIRDLLAESLGYSVLFLKDAVPEGRPVDRKTFEAALVYPFQAFNWLAVANERLREVLAR